MKSRYILYLLHLIVLVICSSIYVGVLDISKFSDYFRVQQFQSYVAHLNCPSELSSLRYCISTGDSSPEELFVGDSSVLALAGAVDRNKNLLILGGGSCPLITGIYGEFSQPKCKFNTDLFNRMLTVGIFSRIKHVYLMHRSEYLLNMPAESYFEPLEALIRKFEMNDVGVTIVFEPQTLSNMSTKCLSRRFFNNSTICKTEYTEVFAIRKVFFEDSTVQSNVNLIFPSLVSKNIYDDYKDSIHLTPAAFPCYYPTLVNYLALVCNK
jgi:hypothetical protein